MFYFVPKWGPTDPTCSPFIKEDFIILYISILGHLECYIQIEWLVDDNVCVYVFHIMTWPALIHDWAWFVDWSHLAWRGAELKAYLPFGLSKVSLTWGQARDNHGGVHKPLILLFWFIVFAAFLYWLSCSIKKLDYIWSFLLTLVLSGSISLFAGILPPIYRNLSSMMHKWARSNVSVREEAWGVHTNQWLRK